MSSRSLFSPRNLSLAAVCFQSTTLAIVLHISQASLRPGQPQYKASSAVLITELAKLLLSFLLALRDTIKERRLLRRPVHPLPSPELYASSDAVRAKDLYCSDPYDMAQKPVHVTTPTRPTPGSNHLRRRSSVQASPTTLSIVLDGSAVGLTGQKLRFPELSTFSWPRPSLSPHLSEKDASPELQELKSDEPLLWRRRNETICNLLYTDIFGSDWWKMGIPAMLFAIQNNLIYVAARNLSVPVFQITFQLKTLITAVAAVVMLGRRLSLTQWVSLILLGLGVATMQIGSLYAKAGDSHAHSKAADAESMDYFTGISAVLISSCCSAVAATYFELVIKRRAKPDGRLAVPNSTGSRDAKPASLWIRNIQLSLFSTLLGVAVVLVQANPTHWGGATSLSLEMDDPMLHWYDPVVRTASGFFVGFHAWTWFVILLQTVGGLLIAIALKHADNVAKGFALAISIVFTFLLSVIIFNFQLTGAAIVGGFAVVASTLLYEMDDKSVRAFFSGQPDPTAPRKPLIRSYHYGLLVALGVTFFVALVPLPSRRFSVTTAAWDLVAAHVDGLQRSPSHIPTVAIADMEAINDLIIKASQNCGWGVRPQRQTTTSPYGHPHPVPSDYPYYVTNTNQYALDDILTTRFMDYPGQVNLLGATAPDFIYLPILSQLYSNPWGCQDPTLMEGIKQTTAFIRQIVASVGRTPYPRIILPIATIRSNLERELFKPEFMEEIRDSVIVVSIEGAPKSYKEAMKYMIDVPYPTGFHLSELALHQSTPAAPGLSAEQSARTTVGDFFLNKERPYLLHYAAAATHPWGRPATEPFNGFALRSVLYNTFSEFVDSPPPNATSKIIFDNIKQAFDGAQNLTAIHEHMESAIFCPMPAGDSPTRRAIYEAILLGCIPVIFRERSYGRLLPSSRDINDVLRYMVYIDENEIISGEGESIIARLERISPKDIKRMQRHLQTIAPKLQWSLPDRELWFPVSAHSQTAKPLGSQPRWNRTESVEERATKVSVPDAFSAFLHELDMIKRGDWVAGISRDTRRGMTPQHFGSWRKVEAESTATLASA